MKPQFRSAIACGALLTIAFAFSAAQPVIESTWDTYSGDWNVAGNWGNVPDEGSFPNNTGGYRYNVVFGAGTAYLSQPIEISHLNLSGGTIRGSADLTVLGPTDLSGGIMGDAGVTTLKGTTTQHGTFVLLYGRTLTNQGTYDWTSGDYLTLSSSSVFNNNVGASFRVSGGIGFNSYGGGTFNNLGTFTKTGSGTIQTFGTVAFNNTGTVDVQAGRLALNGGGSSTGIFVGGGTISFAGHTLLAAGSRVTTDKVEFAGGTTDIEGTYYVEGRTTVDDGIANFITAPARLGSAVVLSGGTTILRGATVTTTTLSMSGGRLDGTGTFAVLGPTDLSAGSMTGTGTTTLHGMTTQGGTITLNSGRTLTNQGTYNWTSGYLNLYSTSGAGSTFNNNDGFNASGSTTMDSNVVGGGTFNNADAFTKTGSGAVTVNRVNFNNTGTVDVQAGTLSLGGPVSQHTGTTLGGGTWKVADNATLNLTNTVGAANITTIGADADVTLRGANSSFSRLTGSLATNQGALRLLDGRDFTAPGTGVFTTSGTLELGAGATFTVPGGLTLASGSHALLQIGGLNPDVDYGRVSVNGMLTLGGALEVVLIDGYKPDIGVGFNLFDWGMAGGTVASIDLPTLDGGHFWDTSNLYVDGSISVIPEPATYAALLAVATLTFVIYRRRREQSRGDF